MFLSNKKRMLVFLLAAFMCLMSFPCFASGNGTFTDQEKLKDEAAENYDAAQKQLENIYFDALERTTDNGGLLSGEPADEWVYRQFYRAFKTVRDGLVFIIMTCEVLGVLIFAFSRKNKKFQRFAVFGLMIGIPLVLALFVFFVGSSPLFKRL